MGMYDTVDAELDCPFCWRQYRYTPLTQAEAMMEIQEYKQQQMEVRHRYLHHKKDVLYMQDYWANRDGFDEIDAWIEQLDTAENIEQYRTRPYLGLAEIQTKEFENLLEEFYVGDEVPKYLGHYFIPEDFKCDGCSTSGNSVYVKVWLEIENRKLKAVLTYDPETGRPAREVF
jgi:hypothetical protein